MKVYRKYKGCVTAAGEKSLEFTIEIDLKNPEFKIKFEDVHPA